MRGRFGESPAPKASAREAPAGQPPVREPLPADASRLPPLPPIFHETLAAGLAALHLELSAAQLDALDGYVRLLLRWTAAINLTAIREPEAVARDHLIDSLTAVGPLRALAAGRLLDLGSGGGVPGIPLAIAMPETTALLVESIGKKASFLRAAVAAGTSTGLPERVDVSGERAEELARPGRERAQWDAVTARAVGSVSELIELAFPLLRVGGSLVAWKREPFEGELAAGRNAARALGGEIGVHEVGVPGFEDRRLVLVRKDRPTAARFPRSPAERKSRPL